MRLHIFAVGRLKAGPEQTLYETYRDRINALARRVALGPLELSEIAESRAREPAQRKADESGRLLKAAGSCDAKLVLDGGGRAMTSEAFARWLAGRRDGGVSVLAILIGGADGHGAPALEQADLTLSLGQMTLPHGLARVVLSEQLYRASTLIAGHPYHRA